MRKMSKLLAVLLALMLLVGVVPASADAQHHYQTNVLTTALGVWVGQAPFLAAVPVDLTKEGTSTYPLLADKTWVVGETSITVKDGALTVTQSFDEKHVYNVDTTILTVVNSLADLKDVDARTGNAAFGEPISIADTLYGDDAVLVFVYDVISFYQAYDEYLDESPNYFWPDDYLRQTVPQADLFAKANSVKRADVQPTPEPTAEPVETATDATVATTTDVDEPAAEASAIDEAYLMYADGSWVNQYWGGEAGEGVTAINADITGEGDYTVGLEFAEPAEGLAFTALGIVNGEKTFPGYFIKINEIRVNGAAIETAKGYTSSDDGVCTRMNIYNEWVGALPEDARSFDGNTSDVNWMIVNKDDFASVSKVEVDFTLMKHAQDEAYLMYADASWAKQYWGGEAGEGVTATNAVVTGAGDYTVGLEFAEPAEGLAFTALGIVNGEKTFPGYFIKINEIRVNGAAIETAKGYTSSDDGVCTRMNIYNEWVGALPEDARSFDGVTEDATWMIVNKDDFASVSKVEVDFTLVPLTDEAYLMFADGAWAKQYWGGEAGEGVTATNAVIDGPGVYTVGLEFAEPAEGLAFTALGVVNGEKTFPGYYINVTDIVINGEPVQVGKGYTSSDDGVCTRQNIFNEWVAELPDDARRADGDMEGASWIVVDKEAFASVKSIEVTFEYIYGVPAQKEEAKLSEEQVTEMLSAEYHAYFGCQTTSYIFRNVWNDASYGKDTEPTFFARLTGWDADSNAVDYGGVFEDVTITGNGTYTVSVTTGDMGFGNDETFRLLFASTDIPAALVEEGYVTISDVKVKIGDARTQEYTELTMDDYVRITLLDEYNQSEAPFGYTVPGPNTTISITFTVDGLAN
ncbi:MAG: hypothetical protein Q4E72_11745 [bacterium]|nr:hypothetical protein [bacterium]